MSKKKSEEKVPANGKNSFNEIEVDSAREDKAIENKDQIIENLTKENQELQDKVLRKIAELDNAIKRCAKEKIELIDYANEKILVQFINIADDLEKAINAAKSSNDIQSLLTGIEMIKNNFDKILMENGVKKQEIEIGMDFDLNLHDAVLSMPSEMPEGKIVEIVQNGYVFREKILRHAKVITSSGIPQTEKEGENEQA